jgi:hypothetical protein
MNCKLTNVKEELLRLNFNSKEDLRKSGLNSISVGLYVMIFDNRVNEDVRDKNPSRNVRDEFLGKVVIPKDTITVKSGKFEKNFLHRMKGYYEHLHHSSNPEFSVYQNILKLCYCLDLTTMVRKNYFNPAAVYEQYWNRSIFNYLSENNLLASSQNNRSEYRIIEFGNALNDRTIIGEKFLSQICGSIDDTFPVFSSVLKSKE